MHACRGMHAEGRKEEQNNVVCVCYYDRQLPVYHVCWIEVFYRSIRSTGMYVTSSQSSADERAVACEVACSGDVPVAGRPLSLKHACMHVHAPTSRS